MPKTGSSAIQKTLLDLPMEDWIYPALTQNGNLSTVFTALFRENPETFPVFQAIGLSVEEVQRRRAHWEAILDVALSVPDKGLIFSAESIVRRDAGGLEAARDYFTARDSTVEIIAYVRPPISMMQSAFQQRLKGNMVSGLDFVAEWPNYRARLEPLDQVFGRKNVMLKLFDPAAFPNGDVVQDFCDTLNIKHAPAPHGRINESLSLEATALLFAQRNRGSGNEMRSVDAMRRNTAFVKTLASLGSQKFQFSPDLVNPVLKKNRADIDWIEGRMDCSLQDAPPNDGRLVTSEDDLLKIATQYAYLLEEKLIGLIRAKPEDPYHQMLRNIEYLRQMNS
jgi:hypothetical protein